MSEFECCICLNSNKSLIMLKCHHSHIVCLECYREIEKCPMCRSNIERDQQLIESWEIENELIKKSANQILSKCYHYEYEYNRILREYQLALDELSGLKSKNNLIHNII